MMHKAGANVSLPIVTGIFARGAKPIGDLGLVYQLLPRSGSGFDLPVCGLYQSLPPRPKDSQSDSHSDSEFAGMAVW